MIPLAYILNYGIHICWAVTSFWFKCTVLQFCVFETVLKSYAIWYHVIAVYRYDISCINLHQPKSHPKMAGISWLCPVVWAWAVPKPLRRQGFFGQLGEAYGKWGHLFLLGTIVGLKPLQLDEWCVHLIHLSIYLSVCLPVCLSPYLSMRLPRCPNLNLNLCLIIDVILSYLIQSVYVTISEAEKVKLVPGPTCLQLI